MPQPHDGAFGKQPPTPATTMRISKAAAFFLIGDDCDQCFAFRPSINRCFKNTCGSALFADAWFPSCSICWFGAVEGHSVSRQRKTNAKYSSSLRQGVLLSADGRLQSVLLCDGHAKMSTLYLLFPRGTLYCSPTIAVLAVLQRCLMFAFSFPHFLRRCCLCVLLAFATLPFSVLLASAIAKKTYQHS
jgi:hypothetical protein